MSKPKQPSKRAGGPSAAVRIRVYKRDRFMCTYCGVPGTDAELEVDHIIPVSKGGSHHMSNLTTACRKCNQEKSDGAPSEPPVARPVGFVGMWFHTFTARGNFEWQGRIIGEDGERWIVQLYSWMDGGPSEVSVLNKSSVPSDSCRIYQARSDWLCAYERTDPGAAQLREIMDGAA